MSDERPGKVLVPQAALELPQRLLERLPEVGPEVSVDEWVQRRVEVPDPEERGDHRLRAGAAVAADRDGHVPGEEREPAQDEGAHDNAEGPRRFVFAPHHGVAAAAAMAEAAAGARVRHLLAASEGHWADDSHGQATSRVPVHADGAAAGHLWPRRDLESLLDLLVHRQIWTDGSRTHLERAYIFVGDRQVRLPRVTHGASAASSVICTRSLLAYAPRSVHGESTGLVAKVRAGYTGQRSKLELLLMASLGFSS